MKILNQAQIAKKIGVTPQAVGKWMRGESFPNFKNLKKFAKATNKSVGEIVNLLTR